MNWKKNFLDVLYENSINKTFDKAISEWILKNIVIDNNFCICSHKIIENFIMKNSFNNKEIIVGNCCILKFPKYQSNNMHLILKAYKKNKINVSLIEYSYNKKTIDNWEYNFMLNVWRKKYLSEKQSIVYNSIKEKIFFKFQKME